MPKSVVAKPSVAAAARELATLIARFEPSMQKLIRVARSALRKRFPTANELVYDYGRSLVISYSPSDRGIEAVVALQATATELRLVLNNGHRIPDPGGILLGKGRMTRHVALTSAAELKRPEIAALMTAAEKLTKPALARTGKGALVIKAGGGK